MTEQDQNQELLINSRRLVYFAAERTLMAWIRSSLGLMALGFVIDRFTLVLHQITTPAVVIPHSKIFSYWGGSLMVLTGALMALVATIRYWLFANNYRHNDVSSTQTGHGILLGVLFTMIVAIFGFIVAGYLFSFGE